MTARWAAGFRDTKARVILLRNRLYRQLRMDLWFPHVPLAFAVGGAGAFALLPAIRHFAAQYFHIHLTKLFDALHPISGTIPALILSGVPSAVVGVLQVLIALALIGRSRIAWLSAIGITLSQLVLAVHTGGAMVTNQSLYVVVLLIALLLFRNGFQRSSLTASTLFALASVIVLLIYGVLGAFLLGAGFSPPITTLPEALYFEIETMSTVGYGDIVPRSLDARLFVISLIALGLTVFATALTAVLGPVLQNQITRTLGERKRKMPHVNHFIIAGDGVLARNTARELRNRGEPVVAIIEAESTGSCLGRVS